MPLPTFVGIGAQRSGSTWLFDALVEHPQVFLPDMKEIHFFRGWETPAACENHDVSLYESYFAPGKTYAAIGDISPGLLGGERAAEWMRPVIPDARLIVVLRDPAERAHSHYTMVSGRWPVRFTFNELANNPGMDDPYEILGEGFYARHLERFFRYYPPEQFLILLYEDLTRDSRAFFRRVCEFIGVDPDFQPSILDSKSNEPLQYRAKWLYLTNVAVATFMARHGMNGVRKAIKRLGLPGLMHCMNSQPLPRNPLEPATRRALVDLYCEDTQRLQEMLGRDLSAWMKA